MDLKIAIFYTEIICLVMGNSSEAAVLEQGGKRTMVDHFLQGLETIYANTVVADVSSVLTEEPIIYRQYKKNPI